MDKPLVSIIILNWNGKEHLQVCLCSVLKSTYSPIEVLVVDNGSTDGSVELVRSYFSSVIVLENRENLGYAEGNNRGIKIARGKYVVTLNNDMIVEPDWLDKPVEYLEKNTRLIAACGRQMNYYNRSIIDSLFHYPAPELLFVRAGHGETMEQNLSFAVPGYVIAVNGGSGIYRKETFEALGGFDSAYCFYNEETDLCMRAFLKGWKCLFVPQSVVYHKEGESFKKTKGQNLYYHERNRMWFVYKFYPLSFILCHFIPLVLEEMRTVKRDVIVQASPKRYLKARIHGSAGLFRYTKERIINVKMFRNRKNEFVAFAKQKIIPL
jgi:GT2 family glycosyltransferase